MRLKNIPNALEKLEELNLLITKPISVDENWIIEVGMGKGEMIASLAQQNPDQKFLGIEKFPSAAVKIARFVKNQNPTNLFVLCKDLIEVPNWVDGKVNQIWLTFSDPWPKKKHLKRRLTYKTFLNVYQKLLSSNGKLRLKTDSESFFNFSKESLVENKWVIDYSINDISQSYFAQENIQTSYEKKWTEKGKNIFYLEAHPL
ncbi:tRNA (guanosine(46)-N7)-methyltransferase TrmB [Mesomycoplasma bovoculi]|uniref:tRNA (guanine-N(7)-)-methyltransferase n=1 Tax=Mesomycoplasma bovoculi M165/69 TaxID=743966 RepID=W5USR0_9BACT|nr:tRNA (guanosine(46)-N7)-methyltransferase TrmB [Mesomycoplasma bovoculi]AHH45146.1 tRNA (guanine-N(7)-)-methyltransferase [Mesomycoplasma bovoculi M165/69]